MRRRAAQRVAGLLLALAGGAVLGGEPCAEPPAGAPIPDVALAEFAAGLEAPVHLTHAGDGSGRLYVVEQGGRIQVLDAQGIRQPGPFLDIRDRVSSGGERGLLSVAFHPDYARNGYFFVDYTTEAAGPLETVIARFGRGPDGRADPRSERVLMRIAQPFANHNGGQIAFGPDGFLYIGMGDGGLAGDPFGHGQDLGTLLGALLRIDVDHEAPPQRYAVPRDNPFVDTPGARPEIWAYGLRNPWRFSFDAQTGLLYLADVGQDRIEEIDIITRGGNYGWDIMEGDRCNRLFTGACRRPGLTAPIFTYDHSQGIAITGGHVYRGTAVPGLCGVYLYADYGSGRLWGLRYRQGAVRAQRLLLETPLNISSFGEDGDGELYVLGHRSGKIMKIVPAPRELRTQGDG